MAVKPTVEFDFPTLDAIGSTKLRKEIYFAIGKMLPDLIREHLERGVSTVKGKGKMVPYKFAKEYPGGLKPANPVNLRLSGDLYKSIKAKVVASILEVGIFDKKNAAKAAGLIAGDTRGGGGGARLAGPRPFMPFKRREVFTDEINSAIIKVVTKEVANFIKKASK